MGIVSKIFGSHSDRELKRITPLANAVMALDGRYTALSDAELQAKTAEFRRRLENGETLDAILVEAFATAREAAWRVLGKKPFLVQVIGGIVLHQGRIAEMRTGEGKTLTAILPAYLNGLEGNGVHIVTVNDYLAKYQSEEMGRVYRFLGLSVGLVIHDIDPNARKASYMADITYGTNNELGFDYLRDNMAIYKEGMVQRGHRFAIVDECDSILIDEARTPLIISGQGDKSTELYETCDRFAMGLKGIRIKEQDTKSLDTDDLDGDYIVDEKARTVTLTSRGIAKAERSFAIDNLQDAENTTISHHINQAIRARGLMKRDVDYVVKDGEVIIVDEFTGRLMFGRRYSDGLHQAIEAKEGVKVERESKTLATITFQNYFRMYEKLSGMTGTALTEAEEFGEIYKLDVVEIPTNRPMIRVDHPDVVYKSMDGKDRAIVAQIKACHDKGQPVLVGTVSIEKSEQISNQIKRIGIKHNVLNAKHHEREADIVAQAGKLGAVTIATNMAGRGTDIMLGGNAEYMARHELRRLGFSDEAVIEADAHGPTENVEVLGAREKYDELVLRFKNEIKQEADKVNETGGLFIIGTERHESRRIDNQLRGRAGRQGDPGESRFFLSMEDDLMRLFGSDRILGMMDAMGLDDDTPIDQKILSGAIENAQKRIESRHYQSRKNVLEYDDVMNQQREMIYGQRRRVLEGESLRPVMQNMVDGWIDRVVFAITGEHKRIDTDTAAEILGQFEGVFLAKYELKANDFDGVSVDEFVETLKQRAANAYSRREIEFTPEVMREVERVLLLRTVDRKWTDHIDAMQELRQGIGLRAYGQNDPKQEYKREGMDMFEEMNSGIRDETSRLIYVVRLNKEQPKREQVAQPTSTSHSNGTAYTNTTKVVRGGVRKVQKAGRNDPCPCGSGKKYKKCCGMNE